MNELHVNLQQSYNSLSSDGFSTHKHRHFVLFEKTFILNYSANL